MEMAENYREKTSFLQEQWRDTRQRAQLEADRRNAARLQAKIIQSIHRKRKTEGKRLPIEDQAEELKGDTPPPEPPPSGGASSSHENPTPEPPGTVDRKVIKRKTKKTKEPKKDGGAQHYSISDNKLTMKQIAEKLKQKRSGRRVVKGKVVPSSKPKVVLGRVVDKSDWYDI